MVSEPTVESTDQGAQVLQELMANVGVAQAYRDTSIPEGTVLLETEGPIGETVRYKKPSSMVRAGKVPLPERFDAYDKFGNHSSLPTAMMSKMLSKPRADSPTERAFHTHTGGVTRATCRICPVPTEPFAETCEWCLKRTAGAVRKRFDDEDAKDRHERAFHPDERTARDLRLDREERRASLEAQQRLAEAMIQMAQGNTPPPVEMEKKKGA